jgi:GNAT superfamily N-acetyltransferase
MLEHLYKKSEKYCEDERALIKELSIKTAEPNQIGTVLEILHDGAEVNLGYRESFLEPKQDALDWLQQGLDMGQYHFVYYDGRLLGMYRLQFEDATWGESADRAGYLHSFVIRKPFRGKGTGAVIIQMIEKELKDNEIYLFRLDCIPVEKLVRYYEDLGFRYVGDISYIGYSGCKYEKRLIKLF